MVNRYNVVIKTNGRNTLQRTIDSISSQLTEHDYLTILWDCEPFELSVNGKYTLVEKYDGTNLGFWGHKAMNKWQEYLEGDYILIADDDDIFVDNIMSVIKKICNEKKLYIFRTIIPYYDRVYYMPSKETKGVDEIRFGDISTQCGVYPNIKNFPLWEPVYGGDWCFFSELGKMIPYEYIDEIIQIKSHPDNNSEISLYAEYGTKVLADIFEILAPSHLEKLKDNEVQFEFKYDKFYYAPYVKNNTYLRTYNNITKIKSELQNKRKDFSTKHLECFEKIFKIVRSKNLI